MPYNYHHHHHHHYLHTNTHTLVNRVGVIQRHFKTVDCNICIWMVFEFEYDSFNEKQTLVRISRIYPNIVQMKLLFCFSCCWSMIPVGVYMNEWTDVFCFVLQSFFNIIIAIDITVNATVFSLLVHKTTETNKPLNCS